MSEITEIMKRQVSGKLKWGSRRREGKSQRERERQRMRRTVIQRATRLLTNSKCINNKLLSWRKEECGAVGGKGEQKVLLFDLPGQH